MGALSPLHWIIILVIVLVLFGPSRLPKLGESLGKTMRAIRSGADADDDEDEPVKANATAKKKPAVNDNAVVEKDE